MKQLFLILFLPISMLFASARSDTFRMFRNEVFVESGSNRGDGVQMAINSGFFKVYSIELDRDLYQFCQTRFMDNPNVHIFQGDSGAILYEVIKEINTPITFWLDGHYSGGKTAKGKSNSPILKELNAIKKHPIKNHTILIDDIRLLGTVWFDYTTLAEVQKKILEINSKYRFIFVDGYAPKDILAAVVDEE